MVIKIEIGISGSGKTTFYKNNHSEKSGYINPDSLRKILCGNVSDQSKNKEVFELAYKNLEKLCQKETEEIWFDATSLSKDSITKILNITSKYGYDCELCIFEDSLNPELCNSRVRKDIENSIDRSNVPEEIITKKQFERFNNLYKNFENLYNELKKEYIGIKFNVRRVTS